jgi:thioredoxin-like negative regulator of GroEL
MIERLIIALALLALGAAVFSVYRRHNLRRIVPTDPLLAELDLAIPTIVYFTTPTCVPCKTQQQPALRMLSEALNGHLQVVQVDATQQPEDAQRWGVQTAPTTFVLDTTGHAVAVNYGVAPLPVLKQQIERSA